MNRLICSTFLILFSSGCIAEVARTETDQVLHAISSSLGWEKRLYGEFYGERCLRKTLQRPRKIYIAFDTRDKLIGFDCQSAIPIRTSTRTFIAYIEDSNIVFGGYLTPSPEAEITAAGSDETCQIDEDDVRKLAKQAKRGTSINLPVDFLKSPSRTPEVKVASDLGIQFATRSMKLWNETQARQNTKFQTIRSASEFLVADALLGDPWIAVVAGEKPQSLSIGISDASRLSDQNFCGIVYNAGTYAGRDTKGQRRSEALDVTFQSRVREASKVGAMR